MYNAAIKWLKIASRWLALLAFILILQPGSSVAQQNEPGIDIRAGFDGYYKEKNWLPITVTIENNGASIEGILQVILDDYTQPDVIYQIPLNLPSVSRKQFRFAVYAESNARAVQVTLLVDGKTLQKAESALRSMSQADPLFGIIAESPSAFTLLAELDNFAELSGVAVVAQLELAEIPENSAALDALNVLVISNANTSLLSEAQLRAIKEWVAAGGRLIVTGGPTWQQTAIGLSQSDLLPLHPNRDLVVPGLLPLQSLANSDRPFEETPQGVIVSTGEIIQNTVSLASITTSGVQVPLVLHRSYGTGAVFYLAFDPALSPFSDWDGSIEFYRQLLEITIERPTWGHGYTDWWAAANAAQSMPGISLPSFLLICGLLAAYVAVLGPINFLILRLLKRREFGWISLPITVVFFSVFVLLVGTLLRSGGPIIGRLSIVQIWPGISTARVNTLVSLYSPNRGTYTFITPQGNLIHRLPNDPPTPNQDLSIRQDGDTVQVPGLHMDSGSLITLAMESSAPASQITAELMLNLDDPQVKLVGQVSNLSELNLQTAVIHTPAGAYKLGDLAPGQTAEVSLVMNSQSVNAFTVPSPASPSGIYPAYQVQGQDQFMHDALDTTDYYESQETYQRYQMLLAALGGYSNPTADVTGIYLTAWTDSSPAAIELSNKYFRRQDTALYIVRLQPEFIATGNILIIPSGLFSRQVLESTFYSTPPYYFYTDQRLSIEDTPLLDVEFSTVQQLALLLDGDTGTGPAAGITVSLWNHTENQWEVQEDIVWGENIIPSPEHYVSEQGAIRILLEGASAQGTQVNDLSFTLTLEH